MLPTAASHHDYPGCHLERFEIKRKRKRKMKRKGEILESEKEREGLI